MKKILLLILASAVLCIAEELGLFNIYTWINETEYSYISYIIRGILIFANIMFLSELYHVMRIGEYYEELEAKK